MSSMNTSTMSTTTTSRVADSVYSVVYDGISDWTEKEAALGRQFFQENKERLLDADWACFRELHKLLNVPDRHLSMYNLHASAGGRFIMEMQEINDYFSEVVAQREYEQTCAFYTALLENGEWIKWMDALQAARAAVRSVDERGLLMTDEHAHLQMLDTVWSRWRKAHSA